MDIKNYLSWMQDIIKDKYNELKPDKKDDRIFSKIHSFEANAIGQIGENFIKKILTKNGITFKDNTKTHNEYDINVISDWNEQKKVEVHVEIKTARLGVRDTFQFNGINPDYSYDILMLIGIDDDSIYFRYFKKEDIKFIGFKKKVRGSKVAKTKIYEIEVDKNKKIALVAMNPFGDVNYKLTLGKERMFNIEYINNCLEEITARLRQ